MLRAACNWSVRIDTAKEQGGSGLSVEVIGVGQQSTPHSHSTLPGHDHGAVHDWGRKESRQPEEEAWAGPGLAGLGFLALPAQSVFSGRCGWRLGW